MEDDIEAAILTQYKRKNSFTKFNEIKRLDIWVSSYRYKEFLQ